MTPSPEKKKPQEKQATKCGSIGSHMCMKRGEGAGVTVPLPPRKKSNVIIRAIWNHFSTYPYYARVRNFARFVHNYYPSVDRPHLNIMSTV